MLDWKLLAKILLGSGSSRPAIPNLRSAEDDSLSFDGLTRGAVVIGNPGSGKTRWLAAQVLNYAIKFPDRPIISFDKSGSFTNDFLSLTYAQSEPVRTELLSRNIYDELGNPEWVVPYPQFSQLYGTTYEEQVQQVINNITKLEPQLVEAPILGDISIKGTGTQLFRLLTGTRNYHGEPWQLTEAKRLLTNQELLRRAAEQLPVGYESVTSFFINEFLINAVKPHEREIRTYALRSVLDVLDTQEMKARLGYFRPGYTMREVIRNGQILLVSGERLNNQERAQHFLFTHLFSSLMDEINKRTPDDPCDAPILWIMDEVYTFFQIPGMAKELGMISTLYRSRKVQPVLVMQALWQLGKELQDSIWSYGNWVIFGVDILNEAYRIAQELFKYDSRQVKIPGRTDNQNPIIEPDRGQYLTSANWLQDLKHRECVMRRYLTEREKDKFVRHVPRTKDLPIVDLPEPLAVIKERLLKRRAVSVSEALRVVSQRHLPDRGSNPPGI